MIAVKSVYSVVCDKCGMVLETNASSARIARDTAERQGWRTFLRICAESHYCPTCAKSQPEKEYYGG